MASAMTISLIIRVGAQPEIDDDGAKMAIYTIAAIAALVIVSLCLCRFCRQHEAGEAGVDLSVMGAIPTFPYSEVKAKKMGKGASACAVCLKDFEEEDTLRWLPKCDHVFHLGCINTWLETNSTCPVCRATLVPRNHDGAGPSSGCSGY